MTDTNRYAFHTIYLHSFKEDNYGYAEAIWLKAPPSDKALDVFKYLCYEVPVKIKVNLDTGEAFAVKFNGEDLANPVQVA